MIQDDSLNLSERAEPAVAETRQNLQLQPEDRSILATLSTQNDRATDLVPSPGEVASFGSTELWGRDEKDAFAARNAFKHSFADALREIKSNLP